MPDLSEKTLFITGASHGIVARPSRLMVKVAHVLKWFQIHP